MTDASVNCLKTNSEPQKSFTHLKLKLKSLLNHKKTEYKKDLSPSREIDSASVNLNFSESHVAFLISSFLPTKDAHAKNPPALID